MAVKTYSVQKDGSKQLSEHFRVREFRCQDGSDAVLVSEELVELLEQIRVHFNAPVTINSAYRTKNHNAKVGGSPKSQHLLGTAADIRVAGATPTEVAQYAETLLGNSGGIGLYGTFTHVDVRASRARWNSTSGKEVAVAGFYGQTDAEKVQSRFGLADETIRYLLAYQYAESLMKKLATMD